MNLERRLLTPHVSRQSIRLHECAQFAYEIWRHLPRQFELGALIPGGGPIGLDPIHVIRDSRENLYVFANFASYQAALTRVTKQNKTTRISVLHYPHLKSADIEVLSFAHVLYSIETACLDRSAGAECIRHLLNERVDSKILERVCGIRRISRKEMAYRTGVSTSILKAQNKALRASTTEQGCIRRSIVERLST